MSGKRWLTGTALRNRLLDLPPGPAEWQLAGVTPAELAARGLVPLDDASGRFVDPAGGERFWPACRAPGEECGPGVTVEESLLRRDLTIHAMGLGDDGGLLDPAGGRDDLDAGRLRHAGPDFARHPVYLLSVAATAAELGRWGFRLAHGTHALMRHMVEAGAVQALAPALVARYWRRALAGTRPSAFLHVLHRCGALARWCPRLDEGWDGIPAHGRQVPEMLESLDGGGEPLHRFHRFLERLPPAVAEEAKRVLDHEHALGT